jgi:hypothetical protein
LRKLIYLVTLLRSPPPPSIPPEGIGPRPGDLRSLAASFNFSELALRAAVAAASWLASFVFADCLGFLGLGVGLFAILVSYRLIMKKII